ncbi:hypothetical protein [Anatilimnocola floriformis]|uniref:hypothetical protein n=1 Tax=Anatilimnocola floriformis TaxID=2948575 RepID=UPI0020C37739|nr:hypothetical protein [Anatilimnocola floriformis]
MSMLQKQAFCPSCRRPTLHQKANAEQNKTFTTGHAILSVFTCGLWIPIAIAWAIWHGMTLGTQKYHCTQCGHAS